MKLKEEKNARLIHVEIERRKNAKYAIEKI